MTQEVDPELLAIFYEEATELIQDFDQYIAQWGEDLNNPGPISEIRRLMHTLKGSAKMVKFSNLADFCHQLEEIIIQLDTEELRPTAKIQQLIAACQTVLHNAVGAILQNQDLPVPLDIIENLQSIQNKVVSPEHASVSHKANKTDTTVSDQPAIYTQDKIKLSIDTMEKLSKLAANTSIARAHLEQQHNRIVDGMETLKHQITVLQEKEQHCSQIPIDFNVPVQELLNTTDNIVNILDAQTDILREQKRDSYFLEDSLTRARMVSFSYLIPRLEGVVKQTAKELDKQIDFQVAQMVGEMDRSVLEKLMPSFEHLLRNAIDHGIEAPDLRQQQEKPTAGKITLSFVRKGAWVVIKIKDDGRGLEVDKIRAKAVKLGYLKPETVLSDREIYSYILMPGFSTKETVTQISGRGIGLDIVDSEIKKLGGNIVIHSVPNKETVFSLRIPLSLSLNKILIFTVADQLFGILLSNIQGATRMQYGDLKQHIEQNTSLHYLQENYNIHYIGALLEKIPFSDLQPNSAHYMPILLLKTEEYAGAFIVDKIVGVQEVVVKTLGRQLLGMRELLGASIIGEGEIVLVLDSYELIQKQIQKEAKNQDIKNQDNINLNTDLQSNILIDSNIANPLTLLLVDDSATIRKATRALLEQDNLHDIIREASDGLEALESMAAVIPDVVLLDLDMPNMGGLEVIEHMKVDSRLMHIPIIVISARSEAEKQAVLKKGADLFFNKPVDPQALLGALALYRQKEPPASCDFN